MMLDIRRPLSHMVYIPTFCALASFLSSCAILSVDVDVYKGPLMNEESVQITQLLAIADGAKPLLVNLRDSLEWRDIGGKHPEKLSGYNDGYIKESELKVPSCTAREWLFTACTKNKEGTSGFHNPLAARVNDVLGLLEGVTDQEQNHPVKSLRDHTSEYLQALHTLQRPPSQSIDKSEDRFRETLKDAPEAYARFAARILFIANHDGLLAGQDSPGLIPGGIGNISRGLLGDSLTDTTSPMVWVDNMKGTGTLVARLRTQYVRTLQAVGNSILVLVNELRAHQASRNDGPLRAKAEANAIESAFMTDPFKVYMNLLHELDEERKGQEALKKSLAMRLADIANEMNKIQAGAAAVTDKTNWDNSKAAAEKGYNALLGKPSGALKLLKLENFDAAFKNLPGKPMDAQDAWNTIYAQAKKVLPQEDFAMAKTHLEMLKNDTSLSPDLSSYSGSWTSVKQKLEGERSALDDQKQKVDDLNRLLTLFTEKAEKSNFENIAEERKTALSTTYTIVKDIKNKVLEKLANQDTFASSKGVYLILVIYLQDSKKAEADTTKQALIQTAIDEMNKRTSPPNFALSANLSDAKEVLDQEIALLRQEHIQAVRNSGSGSEAVGKSLAALETAFQHRASMVRLRPASAYLRTSYPSTSLQDDPNLTWDNLLLQQGLRNIPFSTYLAELFNPDKKHDETITAELDKQYWQNINRVRVSGVGLTNYVLAKDDVGNWYVKHYDGDTSRIFESARKLGMYNLASAGSNASLLAALSKPPAKNDDAQSDSAPQPTQLQRVFERHRTAYDTQTKADLSTLHDLTIGDGLTSAIKDSWKPLTIAPNESLKGTLDGQLSAPSKQLNESVGKIEHDDKTRSGVKVVQSLQAVHNFHRAVRINIDNLSTDQINANAKKAALQTLAHTIQSKLSGLSSNRQHLIQEYEQAIMFIGEATDSNTGDVKKNK